MRKSPTKGSLLFSLAVPFLAVLFLCPSTIFAETDVTDKIQLNKSRLGYDRRAGTSYLDVGLTNISEDVLLTPIKVVIDSISSGDVAVVNADGVTEEGKPYFEYSMEAGQLLADGSIDSKRWTFANPNRARFSYGIRVLGTVPEAAQEIGSAGGTIETESGIKVEIGNGSLTESKQITVEPVPEEEFANVILSDGKQLLGAIDFGPDGLVFEQPITVTFPLDVYVDPDMVLPIYSRDDDEDTFVDSGSTCIVGSDGMTCTGEISHFSVNGPVIEGLIEYIWEIDDKYRYHRSDNGTYQGRWAYFSHNGYRFPNETRENETYPYMWKEDRTICEIVDETLCEVDHMAEKRLACSLLCSVQESEIEEEEHLDKEPVLFIHGYQWLNYFGGGYPYWGKFPNFIEELNNDGREYITFDFQWATNARFEDVAEDLYYAIEKIYSAMGNKKVHIVAHSFGGILARTLLQKILPEGVDLNPDPFVASLTTIGTPHSGIADSQQILHQKLLPKGQDSWTHEWGNQISVHQMGESTLHDLVINDDSHNLDLLEVDFAKGEIASELAKTKMNLPEYLPIQVLIGFTASIEGYETISLNSGDNLISYKGQRFCPALTIDGIMDLLFEQNGFFESPADIATVLKSNVTERLLGLNNEDKHPDDILDTTNHPNFAPYGYKHSRLTLPLGEDPYYLENFMAHDSHRTEHASFLAVKNWLNKYSSDAVVIPYFHASMQLVDSSDPDLGLFADESSFTVILNEMQTLSVSYDGEYLRIPFYPNSQYSIEISIEGYQTKVEDYSTGALIDQPYYDLGSIPLDPCTTEICGDNIDQDCDGSDLQCPVDLDGDLFSVEDGDCNDDNPNIYPTNTNQYCNCTEPNPQGTIEVCDVVDNDCDGNVDEDLGSTPTTCGIGACTATGEELCSDGNWVNTCVEGTGGLEVCDGTDNNCNGDTDEGCPDNPFPIPTDGTSTSGQVSAENYLVYDFTVIPDGSCYTITLTPTSGNPDLYASRYPEDVDDISDILNWDLVCPIEDDCCEDSTNPGLLEDFVTFHSPFEGGNYQSYIAVYGDEDSEYSVTVINGSCPDLDDGLVAYYPFNGNANDESGNGNHGVGNAPTPTDDRFGNPNSAYGFDGDDIIDLDHDVFHDLVDELTITVWFRTTYGGTIINKENPFLPVRRGFSMHLDPINDEPWSGYIECNIFTEDGSRIWDGEFNHYGYHDNNWHFTAITTDMSDGYVYMYFGDQDGELHRIRVGFESSSIGMNPYIVTIGNKYYGGFGFDGNLDDIRIYNRTLSAADILEIYSEEASEIDSDNDGILDDGDGSGTAGDNPCTAGNLDNCDDNCPDTPNTDQADSDGNGIGDVCDSNVVNLAGVWLINFTSNCSSYDDTWVNMEFSEDGIMSWGSCFGTWTTNNNQIAIEVSCNSFSGNFEGAISGDSIEGTYSWSNGATGCWRAYR